MIVRARAKPDREWIEYETRGVEDLAGFEPAPDGSPADIYGGCADIDLGANGFFRVERRGDRFWLVTPEGHPYIHLAVVSVRPGRSRRATGTMASRFGDERTWARSACSLLRDHGFNGTGAWTHEAVFDAEPRVAYTCMWNFMSAFGASLSMTRQVPGHAGYLGECIPLFHPEFETFCNTRAEQLGSRADDPWLLGHFSDNEMPLGRDVLERHLALDPSDERLVHGHRAAWSWLRERHGNDAGVADVTDDDRESFREEVVDRYFRITCGAIRRSDPHHLCLGARFHGQEKLSEGTFRAAGRHLDVVSVNYYGAWGPDLDLVRSWTTWSGIPSMITEFYAKGDDAGFANTTGAGWIVPTQEDRARFYQHFTLGLLESKTCVGWHWFKYMDNDPTDLTTDPSNRDSNKGIVRTDFTPYEPLLAGMDPLNRNVYRLCLYFERDA